MPRIDPDKVNDVAKRGYNPRNMLYLPVDKDPFNKGAKSSVYGLTLPFGTTWEENIDDPDFGEGVRAVSDFINSNFTGEDRKYMQTNAQYINAATLVEDGEDSVNLLNRLEVESHEATHKTVEEDLAGLNVPKSEEELIVRLSDIRHGNATTRDLALKFAEEDGFDEALMEEEFGPMLDTIERISKIMNESKNED